MLLYTVRLSGESFDEEDDLRSFINRPPCLIIFGRSQSAKAQLVNRLLEETIYPVVEEDTECMWRTVRSAEISSFPYNFFGCLDLL